MRYGLGMSPHPPTRLLVLRDMDAIVAEAKSKLRGEQLNKLRAELEAALELADDEATLVMASIKTSYGL